ncbi:hypothetical protein ACO1PK_14900 [Alishewanella sp. d11]|uniref:hypothetical protein n=1 Tax=Alishewanella sp. d11 TaxID=3414030 RepID=UPI003BF831EA
MRINEVLYEQLINWHLVKHNFDGENKPTSASEVYLSQLIEQILNPITESFGKLNITYGFTSPALHRYIQRLSPSGTAPSLDQHACAELNSKGSEICGRTGAACDFIVHGYEDQMHLVAQFICQQLNFDKLYFYGRNRPIHVSISEQPLKHLQIMQQSENGRRYPGKKAFGPDAITLASHL